MLVALLPQFRNRWVDEVAHGLNTREPVTYFNDGNSSIGGLTDGDVYTPIVINNDTFRLRLPNSTANIALSASSGTHRFERRGVYGELDISSIGFANNRVDADSHVCGGGTYFSGGAYDADDGPLRLSMSGALGYEFAKLKDGGVVAVLMDSNNNWRSYLIAGSDSTPALAASSYYFIDPKANTHIKSVGTLDLADINRVFVGVRVSSSFWNPEASVQSLLIAKEMKVSGGTTANPVTFLSLSEITPVITTYAGSLGLLQCKLTIGSGGDAPVCFLGPKGAGAYPPNTDQLESGQIQVESGYFGLTLDTGADDEITYNTPLIADYFKLAGSAPSILNLDFMTVQCGVEVTLQSYLSASNMVFDRCAIVTTNNAELTNCTVKRSTNLFGAVSYSTNMSGGLVADNNAGLVFSSAGTYVLDGVKFENNSFDVVNFSGGIVTINCINGANPSTNLTTAGGTTIINTVATLTISGVPAGAEWRLYEADPAAGTIGTVELAGAESHTGGDISYPYNYIANKNVALQVIDTGYKEFLLYFTLTSDSQAQAVQLVEDGNL